MDKSRIAHLIQKLRSRTATQEETDELESFWYLAQSDDTLFNKLSDDEKESIRSGMFERIGKRITLLETSGKSRSLILPASMWLLKIAASIAVIVAISIFWNEYREEHQRVETAYGEQKTVRLPDGSIIIVNGNTTLKYASSWAIGTHREVWIDGEAFFEVTHKANEEKFIVYTENGVNVQVLGTKFNVKSRRGKAEVMLQEGSVRLDVEKAELMESMTLQPGELATLENSQLMKEKIEPSKYSSWKDHKLIFDQTTLREVAIMLEDTYGMEVVFENKSLAERKLSGQISSADVKDILTAIRETFDISVKQEGNKITFHI